jgi:hypothetical protein
MNIIREWKKVLFAVLNKLGIISEDFTGKIVVNINQGGITDLEKTERLK